LSERAFEGGCLCGSTRFRACGPATNVCYCHCRSCRLGSGAPLVAWVTFPVDRFEIVGGTLSEYASSQGVVRGFCATCGTSLTYAHDGRPAEIDVALATLDDPATLQPGFHVWVSHKPSWFRLDDDLPQHPEWRTSAD
jgi:hypothetical protein